MTDAEWAGTVGVNLTGIFHCLREELRVMAEGGSVVNAASVAGLTGMAKSAPYVASKVCVCVCERERESIRGMLLGFGEKGEKDCRRSLYCRFLVLGNEIGLESDGWACSDCYS